MKKLIPLVIIALGIAGMLSLGCGILFAPVQVGRLMDVNGPLQATGTIADQNGQPLRDVTVELIRLAEKKEIVTGMSAADRKPETRTVGPDFDLFHYGDYAWQMTFTKPGYTPARLLIYVKDTGSPSGMYSWGSPYPMARESIHTITLEKSNRHARNLKITLTREPTTP